MTRRRGPQTPLGRRLRDAIFGRVLQRSTVAGVVSVLCYALVVIAAAESKMVLPNACSLVTDAKAAAALGGSVASRLRPGSGGEDVCLWSAPASAGRNPTLSLLVLRVRKGDFVGSALANGGIPLAGVGEEAFRFPRYPGVLWAWNKDGAVEIQSTSGTSLRLLARFASSALARISRFGAPTPPSGTRAVDLRGCRGLPPVVGRGVEYGGKGFRCLTCEERSLYDKRWFVSALHRVACLCPVDARRDGGRALARVPACLSGSVRASAGVTGHGSWVSERLAADSGRGCRGVARLGLVPLVS